MSTTVSRESSPLIPAASARPADDPIFALNSEASARAATGERILNATLGALVEDDGELAVMPSVTKALARVPARQAAAYAPIAGEPDFNRAVLRDLFGDGPLAERAVSVATAGATGALHHAVVNFLEPGQALLTTSYHWGPYRTIADQTRRAVRTFRMFDEAGRFDLAALDRELGALVAEQGRALVVLNFPCHNPTGYSLDAEEWAGVAQIVRRHAQAAPVALLIDFAYARFAGSGDDAWRRAVRDLSGDATVLIAWTVSKAFAQYGARVGALVAVHDDPEERARIRAALAYSCRGTWSNCNHLGMLAITELLTDSRHRAAADADRQRLIDLLDARVAAFNREAERRGLAYPRYEGGFFVAVFTPDAQATAAHMRELGVYVVPLSGAVRVALCSTPESEVPRLAEALEAGVRAARQQA